MSLRLTDIRLVLPLAIVMSGCVSNKQLPDWVRSPQILTAKYPIQRYLIGHGVSGAASADDLIAKRAAEDMALADIAAAIEVRIESVLEKQETEVEFQGKRSVQEVTYRHTERIVSSLLRGMEVKESYFDPATFNWYAYAVLDRAEAGSLMLQNLQAEIQAIRRQVNNAPQKPLASYLHNLRLQNQALRLNNQLMQAFAFLSTNKIESLQIQVQAILLQLSERLQVQKEKVVVAVKVIMPDNYEFNNQKNELLRRLVQLLEKTGIPVAVNTDFDAHLTAHITLHLEELKGSVNLIRAQSRADFVLVEGQDILLQGDMNPRAETSARTLTREQAAVSSLRKLVPLFLQYVEKDLHSFLEVP